MTRRSDSGSRRSPNAVEPVTSQNTMVTILRASRRGAGAAPIGLPHSRQKRARSGLRVPQLLHTRTPPFCSGRRGKRLPPLRSRRGYAGPGGITAPRRSGGSARPVGPYDRAGMSQPAGRTPRLPSRLGALDLGLRLSAEQEADPAAGRPAAVAAPAPRARRPDRRPPPRPARVRRVRGLGRLGQGRRHQAARRAARPPPRPGRPRSRRPTYDEKRHHFLWRFWPTLPGLGRHGRPRPVVVRAGAGRAGGGLRHRGAVAPGLRRDRGLRATLAAEGMILAKFWLHISDAEQLRRFERRRGRPAQGLEADRRGLAQPGQAGRVRGRGRGHARAHRPPGGAVAS